MADKDDISVEWPKKSGEKIVLNDRMTNPDIRAVIDAIEAGGGTIRFIGGCVRDALLHREIDDVDLSTTERPERVTMLLENAGLKAIPTGIEHGTVTAVSGTQTYQITTLRRDLKTDGRRAEVDYTDNWNDDAGRRDFTFNSMSAAPDGVVYDYYNGLQDLANRRIHFVGNAEERLLEDHLRILRYFRFIAVLGFHIGDQYSYQKCIQHAPLLTKLSGERIRDELFKMLMSENKHDAIGLMISGGVAIHFLPEATSTIRLKRLIWLENSATKVGPLGKDPVRRLASIVETDAVGARKIAERLRLSNAQRDHLITLVDPPWQATSEILGDDLRVLLYRLEPARIIDLCLLEWARVLTNTPVLPLEQSEAWLRIIDTAKAWVDLDFPLSGQDALDCGLAEGPRINEVLNQIEDWWTSGGCRADRDACLRKLRQAADDHF